MIFEMEVGVAIQRPPSPANIRHTHMRLEVPEQANWSRMENEARLTAAHMAARHGVMVTSVTITGVEE